MWCRMNHSNSFFKILFADTKLQRLLIRECQKKKFWKPSHGSLLDKENFSRLWIWGGRFYYPSLENEKLNLKAVTTCPSLLQSEGILYLSSGVPHCFWFSNVVKDTELVTVAKISVLHYNKAKKTDVTAAFDITELSTVFAYWQI